MKILNLYSGIGGNRKLWGDDHDITAVEYNEKIAKIYQDFFPKDKMIVADAHQYLLEHFQEYDFIWSSPPCPSHSKVRMMASKAKSYDPIFPDPALWQEIIFLQYFHNGKWCVENVEPYYKPTVKPTAKLGRHLLWTNFPVIHKDLNDNLTHNERGMHDKGVFDLRNYDTGHRKDQIIRNSVNPELGLHILKESQRDIQGDLFK